MFSATLHTTASDVKISGTFQMAIAIDEIIWGFHMEEKMTDHITMLMKKTLSTKH